MSEKKRVHSGKRTVAVICAAAVFLTAIAWVVGASSKGAYSKSSVYADNYSAVSEDAIDSTYSVGASGTEKYASDTVNGAFMQPDYSVDPDFSVDTDSARRVVERIIVRNASLSVETEKYDNFIKALNGKINDLDGYIAGEQEYDSYSGSMRRGEFCVKIPADKLDSFISFVGEQGLVVSKSVSQDDITYNYVDTQSRITSLEAEESALLAILAKASSVSDTIEVQSRLSEVRQSLESSRSMMIRMQNDVAYSTVNISLSEVDREKTADTSFFDEIKSGFTDSLYNIGVGFKAMLIWGVSALPFVAILAIFGIVVYKVIRIAKNKSQKKKANADGGEVGGGSADS